MKFPFVSCEEDITHNDFYRFELQFCRTVFDFLPCTSVDFLAGSDFFDSETDGPKHGGKEAKVKGVPEKWVAGAKMVRGQMEPVIDPDGSLLFLPICNRNELAGVAVLTGGNKGVYEQYSLEWLQERSRWISREFRRIKQWSHDSVSGLLNGSHLREELSLISCGAELSDGNMPEEHGDNVEWYLFLIEIASRAVHAEQALQSIVRTGAYLDSLLGEQVNVHHLGLGVFGLIWPGKDSDEVQKLGHAILKKLKRQHTVKVNMGIAPLRGDNNKDGQENNADRLLAQAWDALSTARDRGTFSLCIYAAKDIEKHALTPVLPELMVRLKKAWLRKNQFSIVCIQKDLDNKERFPARVMALAGEVFFFQVNGRDAYILLLGMDEHSSLRWAEEFRAKIDSLCIGSFSMGVASYPCPGFKKEDIPLNARKALLHTNYFGPGSMTAFDGVSLNISGDIYYNEGDIAKAIKEYRLGLNLDPENINLLNSLAVIYAQIDQYKKAIPLFERALSIKPKDFMALYNLGSAHLRLNNIDNALNYFEKGLAVDNNYFDLLLQLGQIYCQTGEYKKAVRVLVKAENNGSSSPACSVDEPWERGEAWGGGKELGRGQVYRYLGIAYNGIGKNKEAMTYLQRALTYNSRDAGSLSLLGRLYAVEKQGEDIALSLCQQAVDIEDDNGLHWYCLGFVLWARKEYDKARTALLKCLRFDSRNIEALLLMANIYEKLKAKGKARKIYEKVLKLDGTHKIAGMRLKKINK